MIKIKETNDNAEKGASKSTTSIVKIYLQVVTLRPHCLHETSDKTSCPKLV